MLICVVKVSGKPSTWYCIWMKKWVAPFGGGVDARDIRAAPLIGQGRAGPVRTERFQPEVAAIGIGGLPHRDRDRVVTVSSVISVPAFETVQVNWGRAAPSSTAAANSIPPW